MTTTPGRRSAFRTKSIDTILAQGQGEVDGEGGSSLRRRLGPFDLMGFGIGIVIGTGIFTLTGIVAKNSAGPAVTVSFLVAGVVAALAAFCYAELASSVPTAGSAYTYAYATLGELAAWIIGWDLVLEFALGAAVVARGWSAYLANLLDLPPSLFTEEAPVNVGAIFIVLVLGTVAAVGVRESARVTNALVVVKVAICLFVIVAGLFFIEAANLTPYVPPAQPAAEAESGLAQPLVQALFGLSPTAFGHHRRAVGGSGRLLRLRRLRGGRQPRRGDPAALARPAPRPARHARHLLAALRRRLVRAHRDGRLPPARRGRADRLGLRRRRLRAGRRRSSRSPPSPD